MKANVDPVYRPGSLADSYAVFTIFEQTLSDLLKRMGSKSSTSIENPGALARLWALRQPLYEHLAQTADQFWVAERNGKVIGFSRSILRAGVRQLTEIFVSPGQQSAGLGRELMNRAFPKEEPYAHSIIATTDFRAQGLYLKAGVVPRSALYYFGREPEPLTVDTDLVFKPIVGSQGDLAVLSSLDESIIGFRRDIDHAWLSKNRQGFLYSRQETPVGYGYMGINSGPFALLDRADFPAVLAHAENGASLVGHKHFGLEVPLVNQVAVDYLVKRGFEIDTFVAVVFTDRFFARLGNYIFTSPPFFM